MEHICGCFCSLVFSLYGWLLARVQTGNYCIWIDSDVHVRSRCIAPAMFSSIWRVLRLLRHQWLGSAVRVLQDKWVHGGQLESIERG